MELESILLPGIEAKRPIVIAGPCSAETEEQVMETAKQLAAKGQKIYRAGIWKPRTKPGGFEGIGVEGLAWLKEVKKETGMYVSTEVATAKHVYECLKAGIDILWVGARTTANPFAVQEIADALKGVDIPVLVKNPVNPEAAYRYLPPDHSILGTEYISTGIIGMSSLWTSPSKINQLYLHLIPLPPTHSLRTVWGNPP